MNFIIGQALYSVAGSKIGWVDKVKCNGDAIVAPCVGSGRLEVSIGSLRSGLVKTRDDLKRQNIQRSSPLVILPGQRLFEGPTMLLGTVTKILFTNLSGDFVCHTDLGQAVVSKKFREGVVSIGRRTHVDSCENPS